MAKHIKLTSILIFCICSRLLAQDEWRLIESFENEGLKKGGVSASPTLEDQSGNIWFETNSGNIYQYTNDYPVLTKNLGCATPLKQKKLHNEDCFQFFKDNDGKLWLTSKNKGINQFDGREWVDVSEEIGDYDKHINCSLVDSKGNIWFGTNKGLLRYDMISWQTFADDESHPAIEVRGIFEDRDGNIWSLTTENTLIVHKDGQWKQNELTDFGVEKDAYCTVFPDSQGKVWLISQATIGYFFNDEWLSFGNMLDNLQVINMKKVIKNTFYNLDRRLLIAEGTDGLIWLAHGNGVSVYDNSTWKSFAANKDLPDKWQVHSFLPAMDGHIYTGTFKSDGHIYKLSKTTVEKIPIKGEKFMVSIFEDKDHNIWVSGSKGVFKISAFSLTSEVFQKPNMGYMYHNAFQDSKGRIWFGMQGFKSRVLLYQREKAKAN
jgi:ligand-binding sensor domain-containing protein